MFRSDEVAPKRNLFPKILSAPNMQSAGKPQVASQLLHGPAASGLSPDTATLFQHYADSVSQPQASSAPPARQEEPVRKEEMTGIGSSVAIGRFVTAAKHVETNWSQLKPAERANKLGNAANDELKAVGVPEAPEQLEELGGDAGRFHFKSWTMGLGKGPFSQASITQAEAAEIADTVYHETRHAEQFHRVARLLGGQKRTREQISRQMGIPLRVAADAFRKPIEQTQPESAEAKTFQDSICGKDHQHRTDVLTDLHNKSEAQDKADGDYKVLAANPGTNVLDLDRAKQTMEKAAKEYDDVYENYRALPEEADAWKVGGAVTSAYLSGK